MGGPPPEKLALNELDDDDLNEDEDLKNNEENEGKIEEKLDAVNVVNGKSAAADEENLTKQVETKEDANTESKKVEPSECNDDACEVCDDLANIEVAAETPLDYNAVD